MRNVTHVISRTERWYNTSWYGSTSWHMV